MKNKQKIQKQQNGIKFINSMNFVLFVVLLVLKLTNMIDWSWWIVTLPLWLGLVVFIFLFSICMILFFIGIILYTVGLSFQIDKNITKSKHKDLTKKQKLNKRRMRR